MRKVAAPRRLAFLWPVDVGPHLEVDLAICFEADDAEQGTIVINTDISQFTGILVDLLHGQHLP